MPDRNWKAFESDHKDFDENGDDDSNDIDKNFEITDPEPEHSATVDMQGPIARSKEDFWSDMEDDEDEEDEYDGSNDKFVPQDYVLNYIKSQGANGAHNDEIKKSYFPEFEPERISHVTMYQIDGLYDLQETGVIRREGDRWYSNESYKQEQIEDPNEQFSYDGKKREGVYDANKERKGANEVIDSEILAVLQDAKNGNKITDYSLEQLKALADARMLGLINERNMGSYIDLTNAGMQALEEANTPWELMSAQGKPSEISRSDYIGTPSFGESKTVYKHQSGLVNGTESYETVDVDFSETDSAVEFTCNCGVRVTEANLPKHMEEAHGSKLTEARYKTYKTKDNIGINESDVNVNDIGMGKKTRAGESYAKENMMDEAGLWWDSLPHSDRVSIIGDWSQSDSFDDHVNLSFSELQAKGFNDDADTTVNDILTRYVGNFYKAQGLDDEQWKVAGGDWDGNFSPDWSDTGGQSNTWYGSVLDDHLSTRSGNHLDYTDTSPAYPDPNNWSDQQDMKNLQNEAKTKEDYSLIDSSPEEIEYYERHTNKESDNITEEDMDAVDERAFRGEIPLFDLAMQLAYKSSKEDFDEQSINQDFQSLDNEIADATDKLNQLENDLANARTVYQQERLEEEVQKAKDRLTDLEKDRDNLEMGVFSSEPKFSQWESRKVWKSYEMEDEYAYEEDDDVKVSLNVNDGTLTDKPIEHTDEHHTISDIDSTSPDDEGFSTNNIGSGNYSKSTSYNPEPNKEIGSRHLTSKKGQRNSQDNPASETQTFYSNIVGKLSGMEFDYEDTADDELYRDLYYQQIDEGDENEVFTAVDYEFSSTDNVSLIAVADFINRTTSWLGDERDAQTLAKRWQDTRYS